MTATKPTRATATAGARVMVVDDLAIFREPIAAALEGEGFRAIGVASGREALGLVASVGERPEVILLDVAMPDMDGITFLKRLHEVCGADHLPAVIMLTAKAEKQYVVEAGKLGAKDYMLKSEFSLKELVWRVRKQVEKTRKG